jgi:hypothetical protein
MFTSIITDKARKINRKIRPAVRRGVGFSAGVRKEGAVLQRFQHNGGAAGVGG